MTPTTRTRPFRSQAFLSTVTAATTLTLLLGACTIAEARRPYYPTSYVMPALPYGVRIDLLDEYGNPFPMAYRAGSRHVLGEAGRRYILRVVNPSGRRVEVVAAVDGLDVVDGKTAHFGKRGYIVNPGAEVRIDGWRTSYSQVAAFRFGSVSDSYAGKTTSARNVGVIGVAIFAEREVALSAPIIPLPPIYRGNGDYGARDRRAEEAPSGIPAPAAPPPPVTAQAAPRPAAPPQPESGRSAAAEAAPATKSAARPSVRAGAAVGGAVARREAPPADLRPGLGTEFGERLTSSVRLVSFEREHPSRPTFLAELRYNDRPGLARLGIHFPQPVVYDSEERLRETARPFPGNFAQPPQE